MTDPFRHLLSHPLGLFGNHSIGRPFPRRDGCAGDRRNLQCGQHNGLNRHCSPRPRASGQHHRDSASFQGALYRVYLTAERRRSSAAPNRVLNDFGIILFSNTAGNLERTRQTGKTGQKKVCITRLRNRQLEEYSPQIFFVIL